MAWKNSGALNTGGGDVGAMGGARRAGGITELWCMPVSVNQLLAAAADGKINGKDLSMVSVVGLIVKVENSGHLHNYFLQDSTGIVKLLQGASTPTPGPPPVQIGKYYCAVGKAMKFAESVCVHIDLPPRLIEDFNEITYHGLHVIQAHLLHTKARASPLPAPGLPSSSAAASGGFVPDMARIDSGGFGMMTSPGLDPISNTLLQAVRSLASNSMEGISLRQLRESLPAIPEPNMRNSLSKMTEDGLLYTTIDEEHFKCAG